MWEDRLIEAAYTPPEGERLTFLYEQVSVEFDKKASLYSFPDVNGTYVQDLGRTGRRYPLRVILSGPDYDLDATAWLEALGQAGTGKLEHPVYGTVNVVPTGSIRRRDDLVEQANQAIIEVTFVETTGTIYPSASADPADNVTSSLSDYNDAAAGQFDNQTALDTAVDKASFQSGFNDLLDEAKDGLQVIADAQQNVQAQFNAVYESIDRGLDILVDDPITLALQTLQMIQSPARVIGSIRDRLAGYGDLLDSITGRSDPPPTVNDFSGQDLFASGYVSGSVLSAVNSQFETKNDAVEAAATILEQFDQLVEWRDDNYDRLNVIDTGEAYQQLLNSVGLAAGFLVEISFSLKQERRLVLTRNRTIIDLCAELYGTVDDQLDFFINSNSLTGSEILEVPKGKEVVYYV